MIYCPECGSQVAKIDAFCPFCGISLPPAAAESEGEFANTIAVNQSEVSASAKEDSAPESQEAEDAVPPPPPLMMEETADEMQAGEKPESEISESVLKESQSAEESSNNQTGTYSFTPTSANIDWKTESVDIPADVFGNQTEDKNEEAVKPLEEISTSSERNESADISPEIESKDEAIFEEGFVEREEPQSDLPGRTEDVFVESAENAGLEQANSEIEKDEEVFSPLASDYAEAEIEPINKPDSPFESPSDSDAASPDDTDTMLQPAQSGVSEEFVSDSSREVEETPKSFGDEDFTSVAPIDKPDAELPAPPESQSVFDSVQIVQREEKREPVEEKPIELSANQAPVEEEADLSQKESRSFTSPNMGVGSDTDGGGRSSSKLKPLDEGTVLNGRYEIVRKIGGGGMGAVYLASDKNLGGVLRAVKEMVQSYIEETQQDKAIADFKRESMLLTSLDHPSIPTIYDYFYDEKEARFYLVMKYISGGDLASRLRSANEGKVDEKSVTEWAMQIADVLDYLHNRQPPIVYRDLKPANIMIDGNSGRVMLIDFGIARWINKEEKGVTAVGTMGYAPPELFSGNVESRSDIYSLGSTMFHLLTGADPQSNPLLIFDFQKNPHPRQINPQLSDQMERILMRSVEYNAEKRFESAAEMRQALEDHLANLKANKVSYGVRQTPVAVGLSEEPVFCGFCGQRIIATDMFCAFCGSKQPIAQQGVHHPAPTGFAALQMTAKLMIVGTNELDAPTFSLDKDNNLVGRRDPMSNIFPEVDLSKFDPQTKISRRHARIWRDGSQYMVEDLGSSNGTVLLPIRNETVRLSPHQPHVLTSGDKLKLGDTTMHFIVG